MNQICCLNPECDNPTVPEHTKLCPNCGISLVTLRNRYRPIQALGGGGFAKTYLAVDIDKLNEKCVIKQFAPQTQGTAGLQKSTALFLQEAQQLQQLGEHPHIPALLAYFQDNYRLYLVQQFIDGDDLLAELQQQGIFNEPKIRALLQELLLVLKVVHSQNIIHRDIKPKNIMRRRSDGKLMLIDFGASKQQQGTVQTGTSIGTFGYSSLEQMQEAKVYPSSDLYSLGATCFHFLTGVHPWQLWQEDGYRWVKEWRNHLQQAISPELCQILDKLLQKDAQQRYQSAEEVLLDLNPDNIQPAVAYQHLELPPQPQPQAQQIPPVTLKNNSSRRGFLQTAGLVGGGFVIAVVGQNIFRKNPDGNVNIVDSFTPEPTKSPTPTPTPENPTPTFANNLKTFNFEVVTTDAAGKITNRQNQTAKYFEEDLGNGISVEMVQIPGGNFLMGSPENEAGRSSDESPQHQVSVPSFFIGKYELTQEQYQAVMGENLSKFKGNKLPVERVNWHDAVKFCERLSQKTGHNYRLPTEAEWEYACRAGTTTPFYFGEGITPELVNYTGNSTYASAPQGKYRQQTTEVGTFPPNAFGLYDMHGNIWEWCQDARHTNYNNAPNDGSAWKADNNFRVMRGGSWDLDLKFCRSATRNFYDRAERDFVYCHVGVRLACDLGKNIL
ncbi:bifunctional serine/threonine-protein kinase/formylglycine-generating enzyme family protein [Nodularia sphaerocarpa]|uniref:bifunctional serine/threonine-protein kinase/formylglycine-generating enzyme family protein n=1 Tax=Nodularia sphaerocarpa TaxID=137816 RepID=UPI001EFAAE9C|nr:bifunctional serine/threonine-protein kinase/formylglycine-generating enzyme family protein [Nodularia sphaerocarpa]MDB9375357.1 bifunctional serine/threonine-protein kinase/formylglycine-generating enzyme family protein [Nodularia sphaerocarpa CS-585]MDB9380191.1 bifunctional serine/threonine-protein kinase/formylglycine-generating enzyme family protein [Nodularia sphaerocarpa CS-585A2]ULP71729.1 Serine/threonine-protein kinase B [Nodularia sphaerocarpa UHCC 0038]